MDANKNLRSRLDARLPSALPKLLNKSIYQKITVAAAGRLLRRCPPKIMIIFPLGNPALKQCSADPVRRARVSYDWWQGQRRRARFGRGEIDLFEVLNGCSSALKAPRKTLNGDLQLAYITYRLQVLRIIRGTVG